MKGTDAYYPARDHFSPIILHRYDNGILAEAPLNRPPNRTLDAQGAGHSLSLAAGSDRIESQEVLARGADNGALKNRRLAVRAGP